MSNTELVTVAKGVIDNLDRLRELIPTHTDEGLLLVARALVPANRYLAPRKELVTPKPEALAARGFAKPVKPKPATKAKASDKPTSVANAIERVLIYPGSEASLRDIVKAIKLNGWADLAGGAVLYGAVSRELGRCSQFEKVRRGVYQLRDPNKVLADAIVNDEDEDPPDPESPAEPPSEPFGPLNVLGLLQLNNPTLARDVAKKLGKDSRWVAARLRSLRDEGYVKTVGRHKSGGPLLWVRTS
jgi:hypothetical protein